MMAEQEVPSASHIGVAVLPALLALAQRESLAGHTLLAGIVAGYDMVARTGMAVRSGPFNPHFRPTGLAGALGAAAGASVALRLTEDETVNAVGFAANLASGLNEWSRTRGQEVFVHAGTAARNALIAVDLARAGMTASETVLEGQDGMFAPYASSPQAADIFTAGLGCLDAILQVEHKPYSGCNYILTPVAAAAKLRVDPARIDTVAIRTFHAAQSYPGCDCGGPFTEVTQAKMSLQYGVAAALLRGDVDEAAFTRFSDPALLALIAHCRIEVLDRFNAVYPSCQPAEIAVTLHDGEIMISALDDVPWLPADAVIRRFEQEAARHYGPAAVARIRQHVSGLWYAPDCHALFQELANA